MFPFHPLASFSFSWLYQGSCNTCGSKPKTLQYLHFPQLLLPIEREISASKALTFTSKSFADLKNIFFHNENKLYDLMDNIFSISLHLCFVIPMTKDFSRMWTLGAHFQQEGWDVGS